MAPKKKEPGIVRDYERLGEKGGDTKWDRTGGFMGDPTMARMERWNADGAGVSEEIVDVGSDPNADLHLKKGRGRTDA